MSNEPSDVDVAPEAPADNDPEPSQADPFAQPSVQIETRVPVPGNGPVAVGPQG